MCEVICEWCLQGGVTVLTPMFSGPINTIAIHPEGKAFASGGEDGYVRVHWVSTPRKYRRATLTPCRSLMSPTSVQDLMVIWNPPTRCCRRGKKMARTPFMQGRIVCIS